MANEQIDGNKGNFEGGYMLKRKYGWKPSRPDQRDFIYKKPFKLFLPQEVDLREYCVPVLDQGNLGSCGWNAAVEYAGLLTIKEDKKNGNNTFDPASRLFGYYNTRVIEDTVGYDSGVYIRDVIKAFAKWGVCEETKWPYVIEKFTTKPDQACYDDAIQDRIDKYEKLVNFDDILACLAEGFPVILGISIYESFESEVVAKTGIVPMPLPNESMVGGHAILVVGYKNKSFICQNSWGVNWGDKGFFYLPYDYIKNLSDDRWKITVRGNVQRKEERCCWFCK